MRPNPKKNMVMGPYAGAPLCPRQSRLQHIYHGIGQPYARVDLNPMPESTLSPQSGTFDLAPGFRSSHRNGNHSGCLLCRMENNDEEQSTGLIAVQSERPEAEARVPVHPQVTSLHVFTNGDPDPHVLEPPGSGSFSQRY